MITKNVTCAKCDSCVTKKGYLIEIAGHFYLKTNKTKTLINNGDKLISLNSINSSYIYDILYKYQKKDSIYKLGIVKFEYEDMFGNYKEKDSLFWIKRNIYVLPVQIKLEYKTDIEYYNYFNGEDTLTLKYIKKDKTTPMILEYKKNKKDIKLYTTNCKCEIMSIKLSDNNEVFKIDDP